MNIVKEITLKSDQPHPIWNINTIDGLTIRNMVMLKRFIIRFDTSYIEPSDEELYEYLPLLMNGTEVISLLEIRKAIKRNIFCKMCLQISISPRIPLIKVIEFYNSNLSRKEID
jgi:hypothetical protein